MYICIFIPDVFNLTILQSRSDSPGLFELDAARKEQEHILYVHEELQREGK